MCGCERHGNRKAACTCSCESCESPRCYESHVPDGWYVVDPRQHVVIVSDGEIVRQITDRAPGVFDDLNQIERAVMVARLRAMADYIDRSAPCETGAAS